ncbi:MAG: TIGR02186 family protein, partial [Pseudomonadota bacterium]
EAQERGPGGAEFVREFLRLKGEDGLYEERHDAITFLAPDVFRTTFFLPAIVPTGEYKVSVFLFRDQTFLAGETQTLTIAKSGFSDRVASFAVHKSLLYGLLSVLIAVFTGWLGGVVFRRS